MPAYMPASCDLTREAGATRRSPMASDSVRRHWLRGAAGLGAAALAIGLLGVIGPVSLLLLGLTGLAWRGCPTCWTVGLIGTLADERARRGRTSSAVTPSPPDDHAVTV